MKGTTVLVALLVVAGGVAAPVVGAAIQEDVDDGDAVQNGDRIAGVMGVQQAELEGELERHAYENELERADDNETKAGVVSERVEASEARLQELEERKAELDERREAGEISESRYRAEIARLSAETRAVERTLDRSEEAASELPEETLEEKGVNVTAIRELRTNADGLNGQEVSEIARSVTGDNPGQGDDRSNDRAADGSGGEGERNENADSGEGNADGREENADGGDGNADGGDGNADGGEENPGQSGDPGNSSSDD